LDLQLLKFALSQNILSRETNTFCFIADRKLIDDEILFFIFNHSIPGFFFAVLTSWLKNCYIVKKFFKIFFRKKRSFFFAIKFLYTFTTS